MRRLRLRASKPPNGNENGGLRAAVFVCGFKWAGAVFALLHGAPTQPVLDLQRPELQIEGSQLVSVSIPANRFLPCMAPLQPAPLEYLFME